MKKIHILPALVAVASLSMFVLGAGPNNGPRNDNWYTAKAQHELRDCLNRADEPGYSIDASVTTISACFAGGFITEVNFARSITCHREPCPRAPIVLVGTVQFGCDDTIIDSQCFFGSCSTDADCVTGDWCRPTEGGASECVPFVSEGESCNGFVLPWTREQCEPGLICVPSEPTGDVPGTCATCNYNGEPKFEGESFPSDDGCNTCTCGAGGLIACTERACLPIGEVCGPVVCGEGLVCCNSSCGICTPPGGFCTQQVCSEPQ